MNMLSLLYSTGLNYDFVICEESDFNLSCSVRLRPNPGIKELPTPFLEFCPKFSDWFGPVWETPRNKNVTLVSIEDCSIIYAPKLLR